MEVSALVAGLLLAAALLLQPLRRGRARGRLRSLAAARPAPGDGAPRLGSGRAGWGRVDQVRWVSVAAGISAALVIGGWLGALCGLAAGVTLDRALRRLEPRSERRARLAAAADLPYAGDLLAASLHAGSPPAHALRSVGAVLGGPLGERLRRVAYGLELGAPTPDAWAPLRSVSGGGRVAAAAVRSSQSGAALAGSLTRLADELRAARATACEAAVRRSGVLVVLPLGLCFLPAFVLAGLAPLVLAVLGEVMP